MLWIILVCLNCDVDPARQSHWRAESVLVETETSSSWGRAGDREFASRRECMRAIRRENPETDWSAPDAFGQINKVTHEADYVERFSAIPGVQNGAVNIGCFSTQAPTT